MNPTRRIWTVIAVIVAAFIVANVVLPRVLPRSPIVTDVVVGALLVYIVGTIVAANTGLRPRLPTMRRRRRLRSIPPNAHAAAKFIEEFERRNQR